jgi:hypothetical protein
MHLARDRYNLARHFKAVQPQRNPADEDSHAMIQFRLPEESDKPIIEKWIAADPEHSAIGMKPDFFFVDTAMSLVVGDDRGPGIFMRVDPAAPNSVRLHIQFSPNEVRSAKAMLRGWEAFSQGVCNSGVTRMIFESKNKVLVGFCRRVFGFRKCEGENNDYELLREVN